MGRNNNAELHTQAAYLETDVLVYTSVRWLIYEALSLSHETFASHVFMEGIVANIFTYFAKGIWYFIQLMYTSKSIFMWGEFTPVWENKYAIVEIPLP